MYFQNKPGDDARCKVTNLTNMHGNVGIVGSGTDREGVPLESADFWNVEKEPLTSDVFERRLFETWERHQKVS